MTKEFKKIIKNNETLYVLEDASAGATSAGSVASVALPLGDIKRRIKKLKERSEKVSVPTAKPRNPTGMGSTPGRGTQVHKDKKHDQKMGKQKHKKPFYEQMIEELEALAELDKPSGSMFLKFRGKRLPGDEMMLLGYGGFGNTPKDVTVGNALVKPFPADDAYDVINKIESLFKDKDFVGVEKIILDIPGSLSGQLRDVLDYAEQDPERFELYTGDDLEEPEAKTGGKVIGIGPDGKRIDRTPPKAQVGGSSRGIASTGMVTVQADSNGQRLISGLVSQGKLSRDTKVQGNKITLRKDDYTKMMSVLGNAKFQQMFTKVGSVAETQGSRPIDKFRSKPSWDDGSEPADKNSPYYVAWSGQAWDDEDTSRPKGDAGRILAINIEDKHTAQELAKHYDQLFKVGKFPDELAHSKYVDYSGTYVGSMRKMDGYEKEMLRYDLRSGIVKDYSKEDPINELSKDTLRSYSQAAGREVGDDQRDARSARDKAIHHISHGELKKGAEWSDEADWLNKRAEKRAGGIARATSKIAQKGMEEGSGPKEKQKTPYRDINSPEYRAAADKQKQRMAKDKAAEPGKKMLAKQGVAEGDEPDHEISMASSELTSIAADAANLLDIVKQRSEEEGLEAWQQSKITKAADFMNSVLQSIRGDEEQGVAEGSGPQAGDEVYYGNRLVGTFKGYSKLGKIITEPNVDEMGDEYLNKDAYWDPKDITIKSKQGVAEGGILKSIKRGLQGWDKNAVGPSGEKLGDPRDIVKRAKAMDTDTAKKVRSGLDAASDHSPAGLQKRVLDRKLKDVSESSEDPSYKKGWKLCDKDPSADPQHLFRKHGEGLDRNQFIKGFNDNAKLRGMSIYGDVSGDVDHSTLHYKEFKRDQGVAEGYSELDNLKAKFEKRVSEIIARAKAEGRPLTDREKKAIAILKGKDQGVAEVSSSFQGKLDREKADFKRRELEVELGHERQPHRPASPPPKGMYFYNVSPGQERLAQMVGLKQTKSGKWYSKYPNPEAGGKFGPGKYWEPKSEGVAEGGNELDSGQKRALIDAFKYHWKGGSVEKAIGHVIRSLYVAQYLKSDQFRAAEDFLYHVADMEQGHDEPRPDHEEDRMGLGLSHDSSKSMKEGPEENKKWRDQARDASKEKRPWSPTNLPNYKKSKEQGVAEVLGSEEITPKEASYILNKMEQGVPTSAIVDKFPALYRMMEIIAGEQGLHMDDDIEDIEASLYHNLEDIAQQGNMGEGLRDPKDNPCWKGYKPVGTKKKGGKIVPNCVPTNEDTYTENLISKLNSIVKL